MVWNSLRSFVGLGEDSHRRKEDKNKESMLRIRTTKEEDEERKEAEY